MDEFALRHRSRWTPNSVYGLVRRHALVFTFRRVEFVIKYKSLNPLMVEDHS